jgi:hypothetical protein
MMGDVRSMRYLIGVAALVLGAGAFAQDVVYERFLLPLYGPPVPGAHGSRWGVDAWVRYSGTTGSCRARTYAA